LIINAKASQDPFPWKPLLSVLSICIKIKQMSLRNLSPKKIKEKRLRQSSALSLKMATSPTRSYSGAETPATQDYGGLLVLALVSPPRGRKGSAACI
jgi:hypothetical protein